MIQIGMFLPLVVVLLFAHALAQDANCDFSQVANPGVTYRIDSPNDTGTGSYRPGRRCRWIFSAPVNYQLRADCTLEMPLSSGCNVDRLLISTSGDNSLTNADSYCGRRTVQSISTGRFMTLGLSVSSNSPGGRFTCTVVAQQVQQPPSCSCGVIKSSRIVGGTNASQHEFIWMAGIIDTRVNLILCGGTIVANRVIVTAGHCVQNITPNNLLISVGDSRLSAGLKFSVNSIRIHPNYDSSNFNYDIALLFTNATIPFSDWIGPICLPFRFGNVEPTGANVTLLGWGTLNFGGQTTNNLQKTTTIVISQSECRASEPALTAQQFCTRFPGQDACQNDSGGPVVFLDLATIRANFIGIVSFGRICGSTSPSVQTRVQNFTSWIVNNAPADYCVIP